jgi:DNA-binding LytR/AlgR family response regulator
MIKIALCDDEAKIRGEVSSYINKYAEKKSNQRIEISRFDSAKALDFALDESSFDIFVLDVYIGEEMGTALARSIRKRGIESPIIFLTTSVEHAPESFETSTLRYLIKPLDPKKFYEAMDVALIQVEKMRERFIKFKTENGIESVNASHIICSEAHAHYQHITLLDGLQIRVRMTVAELYGVLAKHDGFARVGSAYIVNLRNVKNVSTYKVELYNDMSIPIPRGKHIEIKKAFWNYQYEGQEE